MKDLIVFCFSSPLRLCLPMLLRGSSCIIHALAMLSYIKDYGRHWSDYLEVTNMFNENKYKIFVLGNSFSQKVDFALVIST